ncbi:MAG TPA: response regulator transcription factor, partial [Bacteroidetes bacterium]|nr:response regulator transcription factor [Bacteroidota bacterium]
MAHILIIEDDPHLGPRLKRNLELSGYRVTLASNGRSGLATALSGSTHLIVLDLMLPLVDGLHILRRLRREKVSTPVIILTAKGTEAERMAGFRSGCDDYVTKPFSLMELIARIRAVLRRSGYEARQLV